MRKLDEWRLSETGDVAVFTGLRTEIELEIDSQGLDVRVRDEVDGVLPVVVIPIEVLRALLSKVPHSVPTKKKAKGKRGKKP